MTPARPLRNVSLWRATAPAASFPPLGGDAEADVVVVGGGITGVLCAWLLRREGRRVILLESRRIGEGSTGDSTGNLYAWPGELSHALRDPARAAAAWQARAEGLDLIERIAREQDVACDFARRPWMAFTQQAGEPALFAQVRDLAARVGAVVRDARDEVPFAARAAIAVDGQAQFHPLAFTRGLAVRCADGEGCRIHEDTTVTAIEPGEPCAVATARGRVRAPWVILATHTPKGPLKVHAALAPYREYGIAAPLRSGRAPGGICWNAGEPHLSLRGAVADGHAHLIAIGEPHKVGQHEATARCYEALVRHAAERFDLGAIHHRWSAQNYASADGLPYVGPGGHGERVLYASGYATHGLTWAAVAAPILVAHVLGRKHPQADLLDPGRRSVLASAQRLVQENANVLGQVLKDLPGLGAKSLDEVGRGEGQVVAAGGEKLAVHRDEAGRLHVVSAICTHLQCIVRWNKAERSWDCPCHGSRFDCDGQVLEGPALAPLAPRSTES